VIGAPGLSSTTAVTASPQRWCGAQAGEAELLAHCRERLSGFKVPKGVVFVTEFPRTGTGKVQKHILRGQFGALYTPNHTEDNPS